MILFLIEGKGEWGVKGPIREKIISLFYIIVPTTMLLRFKKIAALSIILVLLSATIVGKDPTKKHNSKRHTKK